jgi:O-antigen ligase
MPKSKPLVGFLSSLFFLSLFFVDHKIYLGSLVFYPPEILIDVALLVTLLGNWRRAYGKIFALSNWPLWSALALIVLGGIIGAVVSPIFPTSLGALKSWVITPAILFVMIVSFVEKGNRETLLAPALGYGVILSLIGYYDLLFLPHQEFRLQSLFISPNFFAAAVAPLVLVSFHLGCTVKSRRFVYFLVCLILLGAVLLSFSLGSWVGLMIGFVLMTVYLPKKWRKIVLVAMAIFLCLGLYVGWGRLAQQGNSWRARTEIWQVAWQLVKEKPIQGVGLRGFEVEYEQRASQMKTIPVEMVAPQPHNLILAVYLAIGLIGLIGFVWLIIYLLAGQKGLSAATLGLVVILGHGLVDTPYWKTDLVLLFWVYLALIYLNKKQDVQVP